MITKGIITKMLEGNLCEVRLPIFEGAGLLEAIFVATMLLPPGIEYGYETGDIVFVGFVDNALNQPVILGKLYLPNATVATWGDLAGEVSTHTTKSEKSWLSCNTLTMADSGSAQLPKNTTIGDTSLAGIADILSFIKDLRAAGNTNE